MNLPISMKGGPPPMQNPGAGGMSSGPPMGGDDQDGGCPDGCIPVPLAALAQPDDKEVMNTPQQGDAITFQVDAVIDSINGETAYVKPSAVNGTPLEGDNQPSVEDQEDQTDQQEGADLRGQASQMGIQ